MKNPTYTRKTFQDMIVWYNNETGELECVYVDHGNTLVPITDEIKKLQDNWDALVQYIQRLNIGRDKDNYICSMCKQLFQNPPQLTHFAGVYCSECAEKYKQDNSQICSLCGEPYYLCVC